MIDTILLCGNTDDRIGAQPEGAANQNEAEAQWTWIEAELKNSKYVMKIVPKMFFILTSMRDEASIQNF